MAEFVKKNNNKRNNNMRFDKNNDYGTKNPKAGIPIDMWKDVENRNEFQQWMLALYNTSNPNLAKAVKSGKGIAIKADATTPYSVVQVVMDNLQTLKMNKFTLMTALKTEED